MKTSSSNSLRHSSMKFYNKYRMTCKRRQRSTGEACLIVETNNINIIKFSCGKDIVIIAYRSCWKILLPLSFCCDHLNMKWIDKFYVLFIATDWTEAIFRILERKRGWKSYQYYIITPLPVETYSIKDQRLWINNYVWSSHLHTTLLDPVWKKRAYLNK